MSVNRRRTFGEARQARQIVYWAINDGLPPRARLQAFL